VSKDFRYEGFSEPNYTPVPDDLFDVIAPNLTEAELRVLLYIIRRTFGFKRSADAISLTQMVDGITTRDGRVLDRGTGLSRRGVMNGCAGLVEKHIITVTKRLSPQGDNEINVYALRFREVGNQLPYPRAVSTPPVGHEMPPQKTVNNSTVEQHVEDSNAPAQLFAAYDEDRALLLAYAQDLARELNDQAPLNSTTTRLLNLYRGSGLDMDAFIERMLAARRVTQQRTAAIRTPRPDGPGARPKMSYFFAVLEDLAGQDLPATGTESD
jgi:hypothetical protein